MKLLRVDLNCDMGERPEALADGTEESLMRLISSVNIACGVHAGDPGMMEAVVRLARKCGVAIGAHPSFPDRVNFGRTEMQLSSEQISQTVFTQIQMLARIAQQNDCRVTHVKPHGALYNMAARDEQVARAIASGVKRWSDDCILVGLAGSRMLGVWKGEGFPVAAEAFADRRYESDGSLRSRKHTDAVITKPEEAAEQALQVVAYQRVTAISGGVLAMPADTICVHSDSPNAVEIVKKIRDVFAREGIVVEALGDGS